VRDPFAASAGLFRGVAKGAPRTALAPHPARSRFPDVRAPVRLSLCRGFHPTAPRLSNWQAAPRPLPGTAAGGRGTRHSGLAGGPILSRG